MQSYLDKNDLKTAIADSESFMSQFTDSFDENERIALSLPGKVPKGKPRVTDGTVASIVNEGGKRIIQQLPTGKVTVKKIPEIEEHVNAVLTDDILRNANSGGTPRSKAKNAIKKALTIGSSFAYCFPCSRGDWYGADFKLVPARDILFEKGKTSEFDCHKMFMIGWYTLDDLKSIRDTQKKVGDNKKARDEQYEPNWDMSVLDELIDGGVSPKDEENKTTEEKNVVTTEDNGFIKLYHCFQIGKKAEWYTYSKKLDKIAKTEKNPDPRGIIPIHQLVYDEDYSNPYGVSLVTRLAGKQNLLDFEMQVYQYTRGYGMSPTILNYGTVNSRKIKVVPDGIINMGAVSAGNKIEPLILDTSATRDFPTNYGLLKSQIINESGMTADTSTSATVGNPGFSKTDAGVDALQARLGVSDNDIRKNVESWLGRVYETLLNIHFSYKKGKKELQLQIDTAKRLKLANGSKLEVDYDAEYGDIEFSVDAGTTEAANNEKENERLIGVWEVASKFGVQLRVDKQMALFNQLVQNSGVDDPEKLMYSDDEIEEALTQIEQQKQMEQQAMDAQAQQASMPQAEMGGMPPEMPQQDPNALPEMPQQMPQQEQQGISEDEAQAVALLQQRGVPQEDIATALMMMRNNVPDEQIAQVLQGARA